MLLRAFPGNGLKRQISFAGYADVDLRWAPNDSAIYWVGEDHMMSATIETEPELKVGPPRKLFASPWPLAEDRWTAFDVAPDGRFVMVQPADWENRVRHVRVILNWDRKIQRLMQEQGD